MSSRNSLRPVGRSRPVNDAGPAAGASLATTKSVQRLALWSSPFIVFGVFYLAAGIDSTGLVAVFVSIWALGSIYAVDVVEARGWAATLALFSVAVLSPINSTSTVRVIGLAAATIVMILVLFRSARPSVPNSGQIRAGAWLFTSYVLITVASSIGGQTTAAQFLVFLLAFLVAAAVCTLRFTREDVRTFMFGIFGLAVFEVILGVIELQTGRGPLWALVGRTEGPGLRNTFLGSGDFRVLGSLGHPIIYGMIACIVILFAVDMSLALARRWRIVFGLVGVTMLVLSGTRSAVVALSVTLVYLFIVIARSAVTRLRNAFIALIGTAFTVLLFPGLLSALDDSTDYLVNSGSYTHRQGAIEAIPRLLAQEDPLRWLFGTGFNSLSRAYAEGLLQNDGLDVPDNQVVTSLVTTGVIGLLAVVGLFVNAIVRGSRAFTPSLVLVAIMFFSFDALVWPVALLLITVFWLTPREGAVLAEPDGKLAVPSRFDHRGALRPAFRS